MLAMDRVVEVRMVMSNTTGGQIRGDRMDSTMQEEHKDDDRVVRRDFASRGSDARQEDTRQERMDSIREEPELPASAPQEESRQDRMDSSANDEA